MNSLKKKKKKRGGGRGGRQTNLSALTHFAKVIKR